MPTRTKSKAADPFVAPENEVVRGRESRENGPPALRDDWAEADAANAATPPPDGSVFVPLRAVWIDETTQPRIDTKADEDTIHRYADAWDRLPPILVQRDTLQVVDGRHRVMAGGLAGQRLVRVFEEDVAGDELIERAVRENVGHGKPMSARERTHWAREFMTRHPEWSAATIIEYTGVSRGWVVGARQKADRQAEDAGAPKSPKTVTGKDGKVRDMSKSAAANRERSLVKASSETRQADKLYDAISELAGSDATAEQFWTVFGQGSRPAARRLIGRAHAFLTTLIEWYDVPNRGSSDDGV